MNVTVLKMPARMCITFLVLVFTILYAGTCLQAFTLEDEKKLGKEFYDRLKNRNIFIDNPRVNDYITGLGQNLLEKDRGSYPLDFTFSVINDSGINAFATPGGYIYIFTGLIGITENESQLAGVLAHEIAHVRARHVAKMIEKSKKVNFATLAAILAGAFLGSGTEAAAAVTTFSLATATSLNLKYSREFEEEADRMGMSCLVNAGYDGKGMFDFLKIMRQYEFYSNSVPSYFLTHPGTSDRIAYIDGLLHARDYRRGAQNIINDYRRIKTILLIDGRNLDSKINALQGQLKDDPDDIETLYRLAIVEGKLGRVAESITHFKKALSLSPGDADILRDLGIAYFSMGSIEDAIDALRKAYLTNGEDLDTILYLGRSYEVSQDYSTALNLYIQYNRGNPDNIDFYHKLAMMYGKLGRLGESHYNFGLFFTKKNKPQSALFHFKAALKYVAADSALARDIKKEMDVMEVHGHDVKTPKSRW